jgi:hypothetical protein
MSSPRKTLALLLAALTLFLATAGSSAAWHQHIHADAASESHYCLLTLLAHGQVEVSHTVVVPPPATETILSPDCPATVRSFSSVRHLLPPERGPPSATAI